MGVGGRYGKKFGHGGGGTREGQGRELMGGEFSVKEGRKGMGGGKTRKKRE